MNSNMLHYHKFTIERMEYCDMRNDEKSSDELTCTENPVS
ncbi:hypothetical protein SAMN06295960_1559 [Paenibacillus aquistagni]|uniref:Uncharacterized protein n=1 Tax=Paenibacillus aquistagni TaxID=1852522 RepID=A0A1X7JGD0_9BACL|nr:hypothetical protein SAMN06295960_1559 [Paenibacillus aquistagni]